MDNQHRKIKGYKELSQDEIDLMNKVKDLGNNIGTMIDQMEQGHYDDMSFDTRWLAIARTQLQQGFMALTRSIAKPDFF